MTPPSPSTAVQLPNVASAGTGSPSRAPEASSTSWPEMVCPEDGKRLTAHDGELTCPARHHWRVESGIPRMLKLATNYADAFGLQWKTYRKTQLDSYTKTTLSRDRARRCIGEEWWRRLQEPGLQVLEVGCGAGRFTEILTATAASVTSVDMSAAVDANQENFPQDSRHRIIQADVRRLPFAPGQFDVVFCLGVIQHTPIPEQTIEKLYEQVKPGGLLVIDHYTHNLSDYTKLAPIFRFVFCRVSPETGLRWSRRLVDWFLPLHRAVRNHRIAQGILSRVSPVLAYYHSLDLNDELQREWALLDTHDALTDRFKHFRTRRQILRFLESLGGQEVVSEYGGNGVEARCRRPARSEQTA